MGQLSQDWGEKVIDENRQGEVYLSEPSVKSYTSKKFYIESYGCQMNFSDSEIVASILQSEGYSPIESFDSANLIFINTCSIRENAEQKVRQRLKEFKNIKKRNPALMIGVLGCMAERLKSKFLEEEKIVDLVVGPDAYRDLPKLISLTEDGHKAVNVLLSREETYADINPVRMNSNGVTAFISIMRGCDNMCSFCVVPFTRGRERSRDPRSIISEAKVLFENGYREVTLLGQNVDSYRWTHEHSNQLITFAQLLEQVALLNPLLRIRFSTSHPKDITDDVLFIMMKYPNICRHIHLPVQSGSSSVLKRMNRTYDREWYVNKVDRIKSLIPDCGISTDIIAGFCGETEEDHQETLSMIDYAKYNLAYMFAYSERPGTPAAKKFADDVPAEEKNRRLTEIVNLQNWNQRKANEQEVGNIYEVLVEGYSKRSSDFLLGRNSQNKKIIFPKENFSKGEYVRVKITGCTSATLFGKVA